MSRATLVCTLDEQPHIISIADVPYAWAAARIPSNEPITVNLFSAQETAAGQWLMDKAPGATLLVSGALSLDPDSGVPQLYVQVACIATPEQFINELVLVGRLSGDVREAPKSISRSLAVNGFNRSTREPFTEWYTFRGFGGLKERLAGATKGSLCSVAGSLQQRENRESKTYYEVTARSFQVHRKGGSSGSGNYSSAPAGKDAVGYAQSDFGADMPPGLNIEDWS